MATQPDDRGGDFETADDVKAAQLAAAHGSGLEKPFTPAVWKHACKTVGALAIEYGLSKVTLTIVGTNVDVKTEKADVPNDKLTDGGPRP